MYYLLFLCFNSQDRKTQETEMSVQPYRPEQARSLLISEAKQG